MENDLGDLEMAMEEALSLVGGAERAKMQQLLQDSYANKHLQGRC